MADETIEEGGEKAKRDRSPNYPFISLRSAVDRATKFDEYFKRHPSPAIQAGLAWGMKGQSSQAAQTIGALKSFGLLDYEGIGAKRTVKLSDDARTYLRAQQDSIKHEVLKRCALKPKAIAKYWSVWNADRPPDPICLDELVLNGGFTQSAAETFLKVYDDTIAFSGLSKSDSLDDVNSGQDDAVVEEPPELKTNVFGGLKRRIAQRTETGMRHDIFSVEEGAVTIEWPAALSAASLQDIEDWLIIVKRKIARSLKGVEKPEGDEQEQ